MKVVVTSYCANCSSLECSVCKKCRESPLRTGQGSAGSSANLNNRPNSRSLWKIQESNPCHGTTITIGVKTSTHHRRGCDL